MQLFCDDDRVATHEPATPGKRRTDFEPLPNVVAVATAPSRHHASPRSKRIVVRVHA